MVFEAQVDRGRVGVARDVGQGFLGDAVDDELMLGRECGGGLQVPPDREPGLVAEGGGERGQCALQAEILERLGSQPARDPADLFGAVAGGFAQLVELFVQLGRGSWPRGLRPAASRR